MIEHIELPTKTFTGKNPVELTVVLKDSERTYRHKFLIYEDILLDPQASVILDCIKEARESFKAEPEDIVIKTSMVIQ